MAQKIRVQDGSISYAATDPVDSIDVTIENGRLIADEITSANNLDIHSDGVNTMSLNGAAWPNALPADGQFLAGSLAGLSYTQFLRANAGVDNYTQTDLNNNYPDAVAGQFVTGPTVVYLCTAPGTWSIIGGALGYTPVNQAGDTMTGPLILSGDPTVPLGAVTKQYADNIASSINLHQAVRVSSNTDMASASGGSITYDNGTSGVGATLTTTGSFAVIDGIFLGTGERVLVKDESVPNQAWNGVYTLTSNTVLTRATDFDGNPNQEVEAGDMVYVQEGTLAGTSWVQITSGGITVGVSSLVFAQFNGQAPGSALTINTQASDYLITINDAYNTLIRMTSAIAATVTIPLDSTDNLPIGSAILVSQNGAGAITIVGETAGVTIDTPTTYEIGQQFGKIVLIKTGADHWEIEGNLVP